MSRLIIKGGKNLEGVWQLSGNKNEALPLIAASCLFKRGILLRNIPLIEDVKVMMELAKNFGVRIKENNDGAKFKAPSKIKRSLSSYLTSKIRSSLLFLPSLLISHGKATIPSSGGDKIGIRKIDAHLEVFEAFGAKISTSEIKLSKDDYLKKELVKIWLSEPSVTATENAIIMASLRPPRTIIKNAASEPHIVGLGQVFKKGGAEISGLGTNRIEIRGVKELEPVNHKLGEDYMEMGSVLALSAIFGGKVKVLSENFEDYEKIFKTFNKFGKRIVKEGGYLKVVNGKVFKKTAIQEISDGPWPSFPSDLMSPFIILATQSNGQYLFHEKMFESRLYFTDQLKSLGAQLVLCDPHRLLVVGPSKLKGAYLISPDIRAGIALVIAALAAKGTSIIDNVQQLDRGYENLVEKLKSIGADIKRE